MVLVTYFINDINWNLNNLWKTVVSQWMFTLPWECLNFIEFDINKELGTTYCFLTQYENVILQHSILSCQYFQ